jgi:hypothetical protein
MRIGFGPVFVVSGLLGGLAAAACSASSGAVASSFDGGEPAGDSASPTPGLDGGGGGDSSADAAPAPAQTYLRIGHVSPDSPPLDVCVAPHGAIVFQGPLVGQLAAGLAAASGRAGDAGDAGGAQAEEDAGAAGVVYGQISAYVPLPPGQYDVRIVAAGASSCDSAVSFVRPLDDGDGGDDGGSGDGDPSDSGPDATEPGDGSPVDAGARDGTVDGARDASTVGDAGEDAASGEPEWTRLPTLAVGAYATLLVAGDLTPAGDDAPLTVTILPDDVVLGGGAAALRAVNAMPGYPAIDLGISSPAQWMQLFTDVRFGAASAQTSAGNQPVDANGYIPIGPLAEQAMGVRASSSDAGVNVATASSVEIDQGAIATVIAIGGKTGDSASPPALLLCIDNQPSGGLLSDCSVAQ